MYFNYHAKIKRLIASGDLVSAELVKEYNGISPALVLFFMSNKPMPVREHRFEEYFKIFEDLEKKNIIIKI